jgi:hypothetical protein
MSMLVPHNFGTSHLPIAIKTCLHHFGATNGQAKQTTTFIPPFANLNKDDMETKQQPHAKIRPSASGNQQFIVNTKEGSLA